MPLRRAIILRRHVASFKARRALASLHVSLGARVTPRPPPSRLAAAPPAAARSKAPQTLSKSSDSLPKPALPPDSPWRMIPLYGMATIALGMGTYLVMLYISATKPCNDPTIADLENQKDVAARYDITADTFDSEVALTELLSGINGKRKRLTAMCRGHVLEASVGTGRNLGYYNITGKDASVESLTLVDLSPQMIDVCKKKWTALYGNKNDRLRPGLTIRFLTGSALDPLPPAPHSPSSSSSASSSSASSSSASSIPRKYDTILQTMGLCSTPAPQELLINLAQHLDTSNPDARIYLLEHGRSYLPWLNNILDGSAAPHAEKYGCWFNRDIGGVVETAAAAAGLEVARERRYNFGTTWWFELKPRMVVEKEETRREGEVKERGNSSSPTTWRGWSWFSWTSR